jgi:hypothetical protein
MTTAEQIAAIRALLPTTLGSAELRDAIAADIRARSVFSARTGSAVYLSQVAEIVRQIAAGDMDLATGRVTLMQTLDALGYTPEEGFPEVPEGEVPPALAGTLQDLRSARRIDLLLDTQVELVRGRGQQIRGSTPDALYSHPAWELVRLIPRDVPRNWGGMHDGTPPRHMKAIDPRPRWTIAGGQPTSTGRLIALKGDPIWGELGSSGNFDDALDVDFPPFAFNSGMRWLPVRRGEVTALGITGPEGETLDEWERESHRTLIDEQPSIPAPQASMKKVGESIRKALTEDGQITIVGDTATTPDNEDAIRDRIAARRAAREAARQRDMEEAIKSGTTK